MYRLILVLFFTFLLIPIDKCEAAEKAKKGKENLINNGDFSKKKYGWQGNFLVKQNPADKNYYAEIKCKKSKFVKIRFKTKSFLKKLKHIEDFKVSYRLKVSEDYKPFGKNQLYFYASSSRSTTTRSGIQIKSAKKWKTFTSTFSYDFWAKYKKIEIRLGPAEGKVFLDDFTITPIEN